LVGGQWQCLHATKEERTAISFAPDLNAESIFDTPTMRFPTVIALTIALLTGVPATAQLQGKAKAFVYTNLSVGLGYPFAIRASAACLFKKRHELSAGYAFYDRKAQGIPADYKNYFFNNENNYPQEEVRGLEITYGYVIYPHRFADRIRYTLRAGMLIGHQSTPCDYYPVVQTGFISLGPNYGHDTRERTIGAFVIHPTFDYTPRRAFGLTAGVYGIVSEDYSGGGVSIGILLGKVGNRMRQAKKR
jgi:hypothetical protein